MLRRRFGNVLCCLLLILITGKPLLAQDISKLNTREFIIKGGFTLNRIAAKDQSFSSVPYYGWKPGFLLSLMVRKQSILQEIILTYNGGKLSMAKFPEQTLQHLFLEADYTRLYKISDEKSAPLQWLIGGNFDILYSKRDYKHLVNRNNSFQFTASVGLASEVSYDFQNGILSGIILKDRISIPFISLLNQPAFGSEQPEGNLRGEGHSVSSFFKSSHIASFPSYLRIKNSLAIQKSLSESQLLSFQYCWDYYQVSGNNTIKQAIQSLGITYQITL